MKPKRPRKRSLTSVIPQTSASRRVTQATISSFHTLLKRRTRLRSQLATGSIESVEPLTNTLTQVEAEIVAIGGLNAYQDASKLGQSVNRGGDSSRVLIDWLQERRSSLASHLDTKGKGKDVSHKGIVLKMLEIGALTPRNYASCSSWIENTPIDLLSQHPDILQQDFFARPLPSCERDGFDIISCSLVLNFVDDSRERGRMLSLIHNHLKPTPSSLLFLVLPLPCITNSRYTSASSLWNLMRAIGFEMVQDRWTPNGKVGYWLYEWRLGEDDISRWEKKTLENEGSKRKNFAIVLPEGMR